MSNILNIQISILILISSYICYLLKYNLIIYIFIIFLSSILLYITNKTNKKNKNEKIDFNEKLKEIENNFNNKIENMIKTMKKEKNIEFNEKLREIENKFNNKIENIIKTMKEEKNILYKTIILNEKESKYQLFYYKAETKNEYLKIRD